MSYWQTCDYGCLYAEDAMLRLKEGQYGERRCIRHGSPLEPAFHYNGMNRAQAKQAQRAAIAKAEGQS
jgi:hypothetical protein